MKNSDFANRLHQWADLLEIDNGNPFRIRAFRRAADTIQSHAEPLGQMEDSQILEIPGIGKGIVDYIHEFKKSGTMKDFESLRKKYPKGILNLLEIPMLGPKRVGILIKKLKIKTPKDLYNAAQKGKISALPGFGEKIENEIKATGGKTLNAPDRYPLKDVQDLANHVLLYLKKSPHIDKLDIAGSTRRQKQTIGDLDILSTSRTPDRAIMHFVLYPEVKKIIGSGKTKASVIFKNGLQCDFRVVPPESWGSALLYFTGSKAHNVRLREIAQKKKMILNEYGLFKESDKEKPVASKTEESVYKALGLKWIPPNNREDQGEIESAKFQG